METEIEEKGGTVVKNHTFKGFVKIKTTKVEEFVKELLY
jgi:hypothetical protein